MIFFVKSPFPNALGKGRGWGRKNCPVVSVDTGGLGRVDRSEGKFSSVRDKPCKCDSVSRPFSRFQTGRAKARPYNLLLILIENYC